MHVDRISSQRGHRSKFLNSDVFLFFKIVVILANSADPDEMPLYVHFIRVCTVC